MRYQFEERVELDKFGVHLGDVLAHVRRGIRSKLADKLLEAVIDGRHYVVRFREREVDCSDKFFDSVILQAEVSVEAARTLNTVVYDRVFAPLPVPARSVVPSAWERFGGIVREAIFDPDALERRLDAWCERTLARVAGGGGD